MMGAYGTIVIQRVKEFVVTACFIARYLCANTNKSQTLGDRLRHEHQRDESEKNSQCLTMDILEKNRVVKAALRDLGCVQAEDSCCLGDARNNSFHNERYLK